MNKQLNWVTELKGVAILMVLLVHASIRFQLPGNLNSVALFGQMGCQIFFVLSAFLVSMSFEKHEETIWGFYKRRFWGIAPAYWITIVLNILAVYLTVEFYGNSRRLVNFTPINVASNFFLVHGLTLGPANNLIVRGGWYVGTTMIFYLLHPLLQYLYKKFGKSKLLFPIAASLCVFCFFLLGYLVFQRDVHPTTFEYFSFVNQLPCYVIGIALYDLYKNNKLASLNNPVLWWFFLLVISIVFFYCDFPLHLVLLPFTFALCVFFFISFLLKTRIKVPFFLKQVLYSFGKYSYSIYLIHSFVVFDVTRLIFKYLLPQYNEFGWIIWIPCSIAITYYASILFDIIVKAINKRISYIIVK